MRIGIDFDNTIICYDTVFRNFAINWCLIEPTFQGGKLAVRDAIQSGDGGDLAWQRLQGKVYGEYIQHATAYDGFKQFIQVCQEQQDVEVFVVSHKTLYGHFDEKKVNLQVAAKKWLATLGLFDSNPCLIPEENVYFEVTREAKINRIQSLQCTHFIDDLIEVLTAPHFPLSTERLLFSPEPMAEIHPQVKTYSNWSDIQYAFFPINK